ncbi:MAG: glycosyltransferase [Planctomycetota bacterium]
MGDPCAPRVSILIPNFNNGAESSLTGQTDLLGDLLQSLHDTLKDDPTPLEIVAHDDGSTDDSLATLRAWAGRTWRGGQPFLTLLEHEHTGVLSIAANRLVRAARGSILVRLDGDITVHTPNWCQILCAVFDQADPRLGVLGPKQLNEQGLVHAFGDWVLHPKGYHHIAQGATPSVIRQAVECDHVMGCFYVFKRAVYDAVGGFDEAILRGQTVDFGVGARLKGFRCWAIPQVEYVHRHSSRALRDTRADTQDGVDDARQVFERKWGFDRITPDLDAVRARYAGTPLLWNPTVFGGAASAEPAPRAWDDVQHNPDALKRFQQTFNLLAKTITTYCRRDVRKIAVIRCGDGVLPHALAVRGFHALGVDERPDAVSRAESVTAGQTYPVAPPRFTAWPDASETDYDGWADIAMVANIDAQTEEPGRLWRLAQRLAGPDGYILCTAKTEPARAETVLLPRTAFAPSEVSQALTQLWPDRKVLTSPGQNGVPTVALAMPATDPAFGSDDTVLPAPGSWARPDAPAAVSNSAVASAAAGPASEAA